jgi:cytochrome c oxidase accessory protein FixG
VIQLGIHSIVNAVLKEPPVGLYAAHQKVYPREVKGRFNTLRMMSVVSLLGLFYILPWIRWDGRQAVLFDLPARKFYVLGLTFFPQDFFLLTWLLVIAALSLFFFTALAGRLWCGYACPQTVWTEVFVWMERWTEGNRQQRMKLDRSPWNTKKVARKAAKQALWISFSVYTGFTFVGYFTSIHTLSAEVATLSFGGWEWFWMVFYGFATYGNAGFMREQVCKYMCPYARFQSAMFDRNTLVISYDAGRGEPRGSRPRAVDPISRGLGDCIDCKLCVQVCPTGIDIRKGLQLECIACAACIDACDDVMDKMQYPKGLIRYSTQASMEGQKTRVLRPRTFVYGALLMALIAGFFFAIAHRALIEVDVLRDRNALYRRLDDGRIENVYTIRIINKDTRSHAFRVHVEGLPDATLDTERATYTLPAESVASIVARIQVPHTTHGGHDVEVIATTTDDSDFESSAQARFIAPAGT